MDRHFSDNWVVAWGSGCIADLAVEWEPFKAARAALAGVVSVSRARDLGSAITAALPDILAQLTAHTSKAHLSVRTLSLSMAIWLAIMHTASAWWAPLL